MKTEKKSRDVRSRLSIYQMMEEFDLTEASLQAFMEKQSAIADRVIIQVARDGKATTWVVLGADAMQMLLLRS